MDNTPCAEREIVANHQVRHLQLAPDLQLVSEPRHQMLVQVIGHHQLGVGHVFDDQALAVASILDRFHFAQQDHAGGRGLRQSGERLALPLPDFVGAVQVEALGDMKQGRERLAFGHLGTGGLQEFTTHDIPGAPSRHCRSPSRQASFVHQEVHQATHGQLRAVASHALVLHLGRGAGLTRTAFGQGEIQRKRRGLRLQFLADRGPVDLAKPRQLGRRFVVFAVRRVQRSRVGKTLENVLPARECNV